MGFKRKTRTSAGTTAVAPAAVAISPVPAPVPVPTPAPSDPEPQPQVTTEQPQTVQPQPPLVPLAPLVIDARQFQASPETPNPDPDVEEPPLKIRRGGRQPGAQSFKDEDKMRAFTAMKETKPATGADWDRCAEAYNAVATIARRKARDGNFLRNYWASCIKAGLPTPAKAHIEKRMPWEIKEAQGVKWDIETEIHRRHETVIVVTAAGHSYWTASTSTNSGVSGTGPSGVARSADGDPRSIRPAAAGASTSSCSTHKTSYAIHTSRDIHTTNSSGSFLPCGAGTGSTRSTSTSNNRICCAIHI
ncbi:Protein of unknown function [Pyronema omphalodes CBS 100304]|uniref:Uncharacterized protein n=1 Tax=Pyronema omphalodes (strain CBS 100304) TaxID=1076935 RepID=U4LID2_PYROM|nr:Protein of unknown function [Pyronema omphalodes CBS 100304]